MTNQDIRRTAAGSGVKFWQIAEALGIADCNFSRKLRKELPQEEKPPVIRVVLTLLCFWVLEGVYNEEVLKTNVCNAV